MDIRVTVPPANTLTELDALALCALVAISRDRGGLRHSHLGVVYYALCAAFGPELVSGSAHGELSVFSQFVDQNTMMAHINTTRAEIDKACDLLGDCVRLGGIKLFPAQNVSSLLALLETRRSAMIELLNKEAPCPSSS